MLGQIEVPDWSSGRLLKGAYWVVQAGDVDAQIYGRDREKVLGEILSLSLPLPLIRGNKFKKLVQRWN